MKRYHHDQSKLPYKQAKDHLGSLLADRLILESDKETYYRGVGLSTYTIAILLIILYSYWTYGHPGYRWNSATREMLSDSGVDDEDTAWAIWAGPGIVIIAYVLF